jgi:hypothetical protein
MLIESIHKFIDKAAFRDAILKAPSRPQFEILHSIVRADHSQCMALWEAESCEALRDFLEPHIGTTATNEYYAVDETLSTWRRPVRQPVDAGRAHSYAKHLVRAGKKREGLGVFLFNADYNPDVWYVPAGLARGYSVVGDFETAIAQMKEALHRAPENRKARVAGLLARLETGKELH